ncbi:MAG: hypothetical protein LBT97_05965 [Planctomycetota bacterium]|jgi:hypothetical protein|nr:hypothetical protein [Planctomycetota bacterium]
MKLSTFITVILLCLALLAAIVGFGHYRFSKRITAGREQSSASVAATAIDPKEWPTPELPGPVTRYFDYTLGAAASVPSLMETTTNGSFLLPVIGGEHSIRSRHLTAVAGTGYVHDATVSVVPGIWIRFLDIYRQNEFESKKYLDSFVDVKAESINSSLESFLLGFWLLTAPLNPALLRFNARVSWQELDEQSAVVTVSSAGAASASAIAVFDENGGLQSLELREPLEMLPNLPALKTLAAASYAAQNSIMAPTRFSISGMDGARPVVVWRGESALAPAR